MENIIRAGHYKSNYSENSEKIEMIRVLGESDKPGMFLLLEKDAKGNNKLISEGELINSWTYLQTSIEEESKSSLASRLFDGLDDIDDIDDIENQFIDNFEEEFDNIKTIENYKIPSIKDEIKIPTSEEQFLIKILDKISISKNNKKFGTNFPQEKIIIEIEIPIDYNFYKLKETISLLELDKNKISSIILDNSEISNIINELLKEKLEDKFEEKIENKKIQEEKISDINDDRLIHLNKKIESLILPKNDN